MRKKRKTGGLGYMAYNETKRRNNEKYDEKTYKRLTIKLRIEDDKDLLESYRNAIDSGKTGREWLRTLNK